ncbi:hypothetical protein [Janthinobacterium agaricidamnosum]|uniref:Uncharacterized protein n=1 Tax=Janthinobacterium agaricidamnosum NBRC 102515 = DSM 9628 TaxID=1349767 RepID=W0V8K2_9BURK|nr:hypothetical protein [Janthinobacterium agaricidamnosum]CDG83678.1 hypothetical protein GJA_3052 [Janthinobacterium agaricidamnosum NBRC 102515 = DSM 9628]
MSDVVQQALIHAGQENMASGTTPWVVTLVTGEKLTGPISTVAHGIYAIGSSQLKWFASDKVAHLSVSSAGVF